MFVQVIQGPTSQPDALRERLEVWDRELRPGADGWLGATSGTTDEGEYVAVVRFASAEAARRNSDRPEQGAWWEQTAGLFDGEATFHDADDVETWLGGPSNQARFVQVIQGRLVDAGRRRDLLPDMEEWLREHRPEILGGLIAFHGDAFTQVVYFRDEESARRGEAGMDLDEDAQELLGQWMAAVADLRYLDLRSPDHHGS